MNMTRLVFATALVSSTAVHAQQAGGSAPAAPVGGGFSMLLPMLLILVIWYFLLILPQQRKEKKRQEMLKNLKKGDRVVTIGGIHGVVDRTDDRLVTLRFGNVTIDFSRSAIAGLESEESTPEKKK